MFSNSHLNLPNLRRCKVNPLSILTDGKYKGKTFQEVIIEDVEYATYLGDCIDNNWTWPTYILWREQMRLKRVEKYKKANPIQTKNTKPIKKIKLKAEGIFTFGKYRGKRISFIKKIDRSYIDWLNKETKYYIQ
ncbi:MAG TPA: hypothetical protein PLG47_05410 [Candidatus Dojkabacteria bacterium]|nr:hypothetical protein [Candidatus Dojkabacteria bacterium]